MSENTEESIKVAREEIKLRLAITLSPMLLAISIFSLTLVGNIADPSNTIVDEIFSFLSAVCILGAATAADSAMDKGDLSTGDRVTLFGGGYLLFCAAAGVMTAGIPLLYMAKTPSTPIPGWQYLLYCGTGLAVALKLMQNKERAWTVGMFVLCLLSLCATVAR